MFPPRPVPRELGEVFYAFRHECTFAKCSVFAQKSHLKVNFRAILLHIYIFFRNFARFLFNYRRKRICRIVN